MKKLAASGFFLVALSALGFSFKSILVKFAYGYGVDAMTLMLMRTFISLPFFLATFFLMEGMGVFQVKARELLLFAFMGIIGVGCAMLFSFYSLEFIDASLSTLVVFTYPAMTVVMMGVFLKERIATLKVLSLVITFLGLVLVLRVDRGGLLDINSKGIIFALMAAFSFAIYNALSERAMKGVTPIKLISYSVTFLVGFFGLLFGNRHYPASPEVWGIAAMLGIFTGYLPFLCFMYGIKRIGAAKAVVISSLGPVMTVLWASIFLGERLDAIQMSGMVMVALGVIVLKLKSPVRLVTGTGDELKQKVEDLIQERSSKKRAYAFIYMPGMGKKSEGEH